MFKLTIFVSKSLVGYKLRGFDLSYCRLKGTSIKLIAFYQGVGKYRPLPRYDVTDKVCRAVTKQRPRDGKIYWDLFWATTQ
jgi:hypothetical protein